MLLPGVALATSSFGLDIEIWPVDGIEYKQKDAINSGRSQSEPT